MKPVAALEGKRSFDVRPTERAVVTRHSATIDGRSVHYLATAGTILIPNAHEPTASVFYVAFVAHGLGATRKRPVTFAYNGGPGFASAFLDIGAFGPRVVVPPDPSSSPAPPDGIVDNADSVLDKTDLVFVDPVGTGFSRIVGRGSGKTFYGIDGDANAFAQFIHNYVRANDRSASPKYLMGTSYGTTRSAVLVKLLERSGTAIAGVTLMSTVLDFSKVAGTDDDRYWLYLPSETAIAAFHRKIDVAPSALPSLLDAARTFASGPFARALAQGDTLPDADIARIASQLQTFTSLPASEFVRFHLRVSPDRFRKELLSDRNEIVGRNDARFTAHDTDPNGVEAASDPSTAVLRTFASAFDRYVRGELGYVTKEKYVFASDEINERWDWSRGNNSPLGVDVSGDLADAMTLDQNLRVLSINGLYDLTTPFFATEYQLHHLGLAPTLRDRISYRYYPSGHFTYLNSVAHAKLKTDLDDFYGP